MYHGCVPGPPKTVNLEGKQSQSPIGTETDSISSKQRKNSRRLTSGEMQSNNRRAIGFGSSQFGLRDASIKVGGAAWGVSSAALSSNCSTAKVKILR